MGRAHIVAIEAIIKLPKYHLLVIAAAEMHRRSNQRRGRSLMFYSFTKTAEAGARAAVRRGPVEPPRRPPGRFPRQEDARRRGAPRRRGRSLDPEGGRARSLRRPVDLQPASSASCRRAANGRSSSRCRRSRVPPGRSPWARGWAWCCNARTWRREFRGCPAIGRDAGQHGPDNLQAGPGRAAPRDRHHQ